MKITMAFKTWDDNAKRMYAHAAYSKFGGYLPELKRSRAILKRLPLAMVAAVTGKTEKHDANS